MSTHSDVEPITVEEFLDRQVRSWCPDSAPFGADCQLVLCRGFYILTHPSFCELIAPDDDIEDVSELAGTLKGEPDWQNDRFGSRLRAPDTSNDGLLDFAYNEMAKGRDTRRVFTELLAAGVNWGGADSLVRLGALAANRSVTADEIWGVGEPPPDYRSRPQVETADVEVERADAEAMEALWAEEAMRHFPGGAWTGREGEWVASYSDYKRKVYLNDVDVERSGEIAQSVSTHRGVFNRRNEATSNFRAVVTIETSIALFISAIGWGREWDWRLLALQAAAYVWLFSSAHNHFESSLRTYEEKVIRIGTAERT